jgi:hypothetical protein
MRAAIQSLNHSLSDLTPPPPRNLPRLPSPLPNLMEVKG